jgi:hypothetical protein
MELILIAMLWIVVLCHGGEIDKLKKKDKKIGNICKGKL